MKDYIISHLAWLVGVSALPCKTGNTEVTSFHRRNEIVVCCLAFLWDSVHAPCCNAVNNADVGITHKQIRHLRDSQLQCIASVTKHYKTRMLINQSAIHFIRVKEKKTKHSITQERQSADSTVTLLMLKNFIISLKPGNLQGASFIVKYRVLIRKSRKLVSCMTRWVRPVLS